MTLTFHTDEELITFWHKQAREMSFYNASEGESWYRERPMRESCKKELANTTEEIYARGMDLPSDGNYLC